MSVQQNHEGGVYITYRCPKCGYSGCEDRFGIFELITVPHPHIEHADMLEVPIWKLRSVIAITLIAIVGKSKYSRT